MLSMILLSWLSFVKHGRFIALKNKFNVMKLKVFKQPAYSDIYHFKTRFGSPASVFSVATPMQALYIYGMPQMRYIYELECGF
jgi:hypothetical protein